ncbi:hypothetical protein Ahy_A03g015993 [Arachis hypogaea]|uniref:LRR receptor-like serine/threonine-protein kinase n=1 Tax=Arachis hypogaea TaxID=3818 RepID=A0A445E1Y5_ARAHY|nr:hypothetical protein Ahy_A03g015993 [Arachis hypogaea]
MLKIYSVTGLTSLEHLALDGIDLSSVGTELVSAINHVSSLVELHLSHCKMFGPIPSVPSINFTSLAVRDLSSNNLLRIPDWLVNIASLQHIDRRFNALHGRIPLDFGQFPNLLSFKWAESLQNLTSLTHLDVSYNELTGMVTEAHFSNLHKQSVLIGFQLWNVDMHSCIDHNMSLSHNQLEGEMRSRWALRQA